MDSNSTIYKGPVLSDSIELTTHIISIVGGLLANGLVIVVFGFSRSLWTPRNACWCLVMISNVIIVCQAIIHLLAALYQSEILCLMFIIIYGTPYLSHITCIVLATFDRFVALQWSLWYKKHVTNKTIVIAALIVNSVSALILTSPFWTLVETVQCQATRPGLLFNVMALTGLLMCAVCIGIHVRIYFITLGHIRRNPRLLQNDNLVVYRSNGSLFPEDTVPGHQRFSAPKFIVPVEQNRRISRPEVRSALTLIFGLLPMFVVLVPSAMSSLVPFVCSYFPNTCGNMPLFHRIMRQFSLLNVVYSPVIYLYSSKEFQLALQRFVRRLLRR